MEFLPFSTGDGESDLVACFILKMPRLDWFKQNVIAALSQMIYPENWVDLGTADIETANDYAAKMVKEIIVANFDPLPAGRVTAYAGIVIPEGWLLCDGQSIAVADYPELFYAIGYVWGGSGANFNVPDLRDKSLTGAGGTYALTDSGGESEVTLTTPQLPSHDHVASGTSVTDLGHAHGEGNAIPTAILIGVGAPAPSALPSVGVTAAASANLVVTDPVISATGSDQPHNNLPPFVALNYIIYAGA